MESEQELFENRRKQIEKEEKKKIADKLKRFDEVFRMLLLVMTVTTSIGLSSYSEINLFGTLVYFVMALGFWMLGNLLGSNVFMRDLEIILKLNAWFLVLLLTASTFAKFGLKITLLDPLTKIPIAVSTFMLTILAYNYFEDIIDPDTRHKYLRVHLYFIALFLGGYFVF